MKSQPDIEDIDLLNSSMIQIVPDYIDQRNNENSEKAKALGGKEYYIPKAMILISSAPIFESMKEILTSFYEKATYRINYPIDSYIYYLTYEVPLPAFGTKVKFSLPNLKYIAVGDNSYWAKYLCNYFSSPYLSFQNLYKVLYWFLWQVGNTLLVSNDVNKLVTVSEVLSTIIYPFKYDDPYVPLLAPNMMKSIEAPFPWHLGMLVSQTFWAFKFYLERVNQHLG